MSEHSGLIARYRAQFAMHDIAPDIRWRFGCLEIVMPASGRLFGFPQSLAYSERGVHRANEIIADEEAAAASALQLFQRRQ